jgi:hypothetical protein
MIDRQHRDGTERDREECAMTWSARRSPGLVRSIA